MGLTKIDDRGLKTPIDLLDNEKIRFGTGNDLEIYHNGSNSYITDSGTGALRINSSDARILNAAGTEDMIRCIENGAVELYYDNDMHLSTSASGCFTNGSFSFRTDGNTEEILYDQANGKLRFNDNKKANFGSGDDLQIYHDGGDSVINNNGGNLYINAKTGETAIRINRDADVQLYYDNSKKLETLSTGIEVTGFVKQNGMQLGSNQLRASGTGPMHITTANGNGTVDINVHSTHVEINGNLLSATDNTDNLGSDTVRWANLFLSGDLDMNDSDKIKLGTGDDLQLYHDGSNSYLKAISGGAGDLYVFADNKTIYLRPKSGEDGIKVIPDAAVELYHDNTKRLETTSWGASVTGTLVASSNIKTASDTGKLMVGAGDDLQIFHDGTNTMIDNDTGDLKISSSGTLRLRGDAVAVQSENQGETMGYFSLNGASTLYYDNAEKIQTQANGITITGNCDINGGALYLEDNQKANFGYGNDLQIYHDGSHNRIRNNVANRNIYIEGVDNESATPFIYLNPRRNSTGLSVKANQGVDLYYDGTKRFETLSGGAKVNGTLQVDGQIHPYSDNNNDLGLAGNRWQDLYLSGNVYLGGTGSANALDDYEEGTFTPSYPVGNAVGKMFNSCSYSNTAGKYTKIGNAVFFTLRIQAQSINYFRNSTHVQIEGLPFTAVSSQTGSQGGAVFSVASAVDDGNSGKVPTLHISSNTSKIVFYTPKGHSYTVGGSNSSNDGDNSWQSALHIHGQYFTA